VGDKGRKKDGEKGTGKRNARAQSRQRNVDLAGLKKNFPEKKSQTTHKRKQQQEGTGGQKKDNVKPAARALDKKICRYGKKC